MQARPIVITEKMVKLKTLQLFRMGFDTVQIAQAKDKSEAQIYNWLSRAREAERSQIQSLKSSGSPG